MNEAKRTGQEPVVDLIPTQAHGRSLLLDHGIDKAIQEYVDTTRAAGGVINTAIITVAAVGIVSSCDMTALRQLGGQYRNHPKLGQVVSQKDEIFKEKVL